MVLASSSHRQVLGQSSWVGGSWRRELLGGRAHRMRELLGHGGAAGSAAGAAPARGPLGSRVGELLSPGASWARLRRHSPACYLAARSAPGWRAPLKLALRLAAWWRDRQGLRVQAQVLRLRWGIEGERFRRVTLRWQCS
jgi:hypothetical protein